MEKLIDNEKLNKTKRTTKSRLSKIIYEVLLIFKVENEEEFINHLKKINVNTNQVCAKELKRGMSAWVCKDCEVDSSCIICNECYEKSIEKHINHKKSLKTSVSGCCDCGDPDSWSSSGFCSDHQGIIRTDEQIKELISKTFDEDTINKIDRKFKKLFTLMSEIIKEYEIGHESQHIIIITDVIKYLGILASSNSAILHLIVYCFFQNFPLTTNHICFKLLQDSKEARKQELSNEEHVCCCTFFQNLIRIWDKNFDEKMKFENIFYTFIKSYKFKYLFAFSYLTLYDIIMINDSDTIKSFSVQIMTVEDIAEVIVLSEDFVNNLFQKLFYLTNLYFDGKDSLNFEKNCDTLFQINFEFFMVIVYLSKPRPAKILSQYVTIFKTLIDIITIIQNKIKFKITNNFQHEGFQENLVLIEFYLLNLFSLLTTNFDFSNQNNADEIIFYLLNKIQLKNYNQLETDEYSFNIPLNRALSIFLNRYSFSESARLNVDLFDSVNNILTKYFNSINNGQSFDNFLINIVKETNKVIGFINSISLKKWVYYGENMMYYQVLYYFYDLFYLCDYTLVKLIFSQLQSFSISQYLYLSNQNDPYQQFYNNLLINLNYNETESDIQQLLLVKNLQFLIKVLLNESFILDLLAYSYEKISSSKLDDHLLLNLILKEYDKFRQFVKCKLIHQFLSKANSMYFSEITKLLPSYIKKILNEKDIEELIDDMCDKSISKNKTTLFRLKNKFLENSDLYLIIDPTSVTNAEKYLCDFKKNEISLLNSPEYESFYFSKLLQKKIISNFFENKENLEQCVRITNFLLKNKELKEISINPNMILVFMKLILIYINSCKSYKYLHKYESIISNKEIVDNLSSVYNDSNLDVCCKYIKEKILLLCPVLNYEEKDSKMNTLHMKEKMREMKEKTAKLFRIKTDSFKKNLEMEVDEISNKSEMLNSNNILMTDISSENSFDCIFCLSSINSQEFFSKPFGKVALICCDSFMYHTKLQTIKKEYEKIITKYYLETHNEQQLLVIDLMLSYKRAKPDIKKTLRYASCNHYVHFSCYQLLIAKYSISDSKQILFKCPLCKSMSNAFMPSYDYINMCNSENTQKFLKSFSLSEIFWMYNNKDSTNLIKFMNEKFKYENVLVENITINSLSQIIEKVVSLKTKVPFVLDDFKNKSNQFKFYDILKNFFINSLNYLHIFKNDKLSLVNIFDMLKDFILSLKILIKANFIDGEIFFTRFNYIQYYWTTDFIKEEFFSYNIDSDQVSNLILEHLFLILILLDHTELNYLNIVFIHYLPLILIQFFVRQMFIKYEYRISFESFEKYFTLDNFMVLINSPHLCEDIKNFKMFLSFYLRKLVLIKNIFKDNKLSLHKENFIDIEEEFYFCINELEISLLNTNEGIFDINPEKIYPSFWTKSYRLNFKDLTINLFNNYFNSKFNSFKNLISEKNFNECMYINPSFLLLTNDINFDFIFIPDKLLDLSMKYYKNLCQNCNTNPAYSILCIVCGEKICYVKSCCRNYGLKKNIYEYVWHNKICGVGNGIYINLNNGEIIMSLLGNFVNTKIGIYVNKYGETMQGNSISDQYFLDEDRLKLLLDQFKNLSYRTHFKNQINYFELFNEDI